METGPVHRQAALVSISRLCGLPLEHQRHPGNLVDDLAGDSSQHKEAEVEIVEAGDDFQKESGAAKGGRGVHCKPRRVGEGMRYRQGTVQAQEDRLVLNIHGAQVE